MIHGDFFHGEMGKNSDQPVITLDVLRLIPEDLYDPCMEHPLGRL